MSVKIYTIQQLKQQEKIKISNGKYKAFVQEWQTRKNINSKTAIIMCMYLALLIIVGVTVFVILEKGGI